MESKERKKSLRSQEEAPYNSEYTYNVYGENSPVDIVASTVVISDNQNQSCFTARFWILGTLLTILSSAISQYLYFQNYNLNSLLLLSQLYTYIGGVVLGKILPKRKFKLFGSSFTLNPEEFNYKEHMLITVCVTVGGGCAEAINVLAINNLLGDKLTNQGSIDNQNTMTSYLFGIVLLVSSQCLGIGMAGYVKRVLVEPSAMVWPFTLVQVSLYNLLHKRTNTSYEYIQRRVFIILGIFIFLYQLLPGYFFPILSSVAVLCLLNPQSLVMSNLSSGFHGLGILNCSFDWNVIGRFGPLYTPFWAQMNFYLGSILMLWVIMPISYYGLNLWNATRFPITATSIYDQHGVPVELSELINITNKFLGSKNMNSSLVQESSKYISTYAALSTGFAFASAASTIMHVWLYYRRSIKVYTSTASITNNDIHVKLMKTYKEVPGSVFLIIFLACVAALAFIGRVGYIALPIWGTIFASLVGTAMALPIGVIQAISNIQINVDSTCRLLHGLFITPTSSLSNGFFKIISSSSIFQCLSLISNFKLGLYLKVPYRKILFCQVYGTILGCLTNFIVFRLFISHKRNELIASLGMHNHLQETKLEYAIALPNVNYSLEMPSKFLKDSLVWGVLGPRALFYQNGPYKYLLLFLLLGLVLPIPFYYLYKKYPKQRWHLVNVPIFTLGTFTTMNFPKNYLTCSFALAFVFQYYLYRYHHQKWSRYNYLVSAALDLGTQLSGIVAYVLISLGITQLLFSTWWKDQSSNFEHCYVQSTI